MRDLEQGDAVEHKKVVAAVPAVHIETGHQFHP